MLRAFQIVPHCLLYIILPMMYCVLIHILGKNISGKTFLVTRSISSVFSFLMGQQYGRPLLCMYMFIISIVTERGMYKPNRAGIIS